MSEPGVRGIGRGCCMEAALSPGLSVGGEGDLSLFLGSAGVTCASDLGKGCARQGDHVIRCSSQDAR